MQKLLAQWWFRIIIYLLVLIIIASINYLLSLPDLISTLFFVVSITIVSVLIQALRAGSDYKAFGLQLDRFTLPDIAKGLIIVLIINALFILIGLIFGYKYSLIDDFVNYNYNTLLYYLGYLFLMAFSEEVIFRGIIFQSLRERFGNIISIVIMSLFFSLAHFMNPNSTTMGLINIILAGILLSVLYISTESLWLAISFHFFWNLNQQLILGSNISGIDFGIQMFKLSAIGGSSSWLFGSSFGIEEGVLTTIILTILIFVSFRINKENPFIMATKFRIRNEESKLLNL